MPCDALMRWEWERGAVLLGDPAPDPEGDTPAEPAARQAQARRSALLARTADDERAEVRPQIK